MRTRIQTRHLQLEMLEDRCTPSTFAAFDLGNPESGPFPSDRFTVADARQLTGRRVDLPLPDRAMRPSDYEDISVLNTLDGFNLQPRLSISFSGPIDVATVSSNTIFVIKLADPTAPEEGGGQVTGINQTVWDVATNTLHVESDELLEQHTRYALIVTHGVRDADGLSVEPSEAFERFRHDLNFGQTADPDLKEYRKDLLDALSAAELAGVRPKDVVTASVFTTLSATAVLEKIRDQVKAATPAPADFLLGPGGSRTVFPLDEVTRITWRQQTGVNPSVFSPVNLDLSPLRDIFPGAVGSLGFGKYLSPDYEVHPGEYIPAVGTRTGTPAVQGTNEIYFNLFLPSGPKPDGGWPVAFFGHGASRNKNMEPLPVAATMAAHGIATVIINVPGNGFGPLGTLTVNQTGADPVTFSAGGRGIDQDGDHIIGVREGQFATAPQTIVSNRDAQRQTVADLMQLVRVIEVGTDVDGDGSHDLDPSRIYFFGQSFGGIIGTIFLAVEPSVRAGVLNVPGGSWVELSRLSPGNRPLVGQSLASRVPSLINSPGVTQIEGVAVAAGPAFNENMPLRDDIPLTVRLADGTSHVIQSPVINTVAGAMAIQEVIENTEWVSQSGNPVAYAPHLRKAPLAGLPAKSVIIQFAKGDQIVPNPTATSLLRAGDLADRTTFYRNDLAFAENPAVPKNPHGFLTAVSGVPLVVEIALGAQRQIATFFASDGTVIIHPEPSRFFETPIAGPLPEDLNFIIAPAEPPLRVESVVLNDGSAQRSMVNSLTISFGGVVTLHPGAFELHGHNGSEVSLNVAASVVGGRTVAVLTFRGTDIIGGSLADASYTLAIRADWAHDASGQELDGDGDGIAGGDRTEAFFRLFGDSDGDRELDWLDGDLFRSAFGKSIGDAGYLWFFDFDGDGDVDGLDNGQFNRRFGQH